jgi:hypothetical protein
MFRQSHLCCYVMKTKVKAPLGLDGDSLRSDITSVGLCRLGLWECRLNPYPMILRFVAEDVKVGIPTNFFPQFMTTSFMRKSKHSSCQLLLPYIHRKVKTANVWLFKIQLLSYLKIRSILWTERLCYSKFPKDMLFQDSKGFNIK